MPILLLLGCTLLSSTSPRAGAVTDPDALELDLRFRPAQIGTEDVVRAIARQPDGKLLVGGGFASVNGLPCPGLLRLNADGTADTTFLFPYQPLHQYGYVSSLLVQPDGKILVGGYGHTMYLEDKPRGVLRLNSDGSLDSAFHLPELGRDAAVQCIALQPDGKILVGGEFDTANGVPRRGIIRLLPDGTLDATFPDHPFRAGDSDGVYSIALQTDGKILVGGWMATDEWPYDIARLNSDGSLDRSFIPPQVTEGRVHDIALQPDGKILVSAGGFGSTYGIVDYELVRLNSDGSLDPGFQPFRWPELAKPMTIALQQDGRIFLGANGAGVVRLQSNGTVDTWVTAVTGQVNEILIEPNGSILLGGQVWEPANTSLRCGVVRLSTEMPPENPGRLDLAFNPAGPEGRLGLAQGTVDIVALAEQPDGKVIIAGKLLGVDGFPRTTLARLNPNGSLDTSFASGIALDPSFNLKVVVQPNSKILVSSERLLRLNANGTVDSAFHTETSQGIRALGLQPDGKIVIAGWDETGFVARLNQDGTTDTSFTRAQPQLVPHALTVTPAGKVLVAGGWAGSGYVWRINADGQTDPTFAKVTANDAIYDVVNAPGGGILIGGSFNSVAGQKRLSLARLTETGSIDPLFDPRITSVNPHVTVFKLQALQTGEVLIAGLHPHTFANGWSTGNGYLLLMKLDGGGREDQAFSTRFGEHLWMQYTYAHSLLVQTSGTILVGGELPDRGLLRVLPDGSLDTAFQPNLQGNPGIVEHLELTEEGKLYVQGRFSTLNGASRPGLARLNPDGTVDPGFVPKLPPQSRALAFAQAANGPLIVATGKGYWERGALVRLDARGERDLAFAPVIRWSNELARVSCLCIQPDNRILIAGYFNTVNEVFRPGLARLNADGTLDPTFNPGAGPQSLYGDWAEIAVISVQPDGKILVGGTFTRVDGSPRPVLARLNANGTVDAGFLPEFSERHLFWSVTALHVQHDGKILVGFRVDTESGPEPALVRLTPNGALDPDFGVGEGLTDRGEVAAINAITLQPDGKILIGGKFETFDGVPRVNIARLFPDGEMDPSFEVFWGFPPPGIIWWSAGEVFDLALQQDAKVIAGGDFSLIENQERWGVARFFGGPPESGLPRITTQPLDQTVAQGGTATFAVEASGMGPFGFQWQKNGKNVPNATNAVLVLSAVEMADVGAYHVWVSNASGVIQSKPAALLVMPTPVPSAPREQRMPAIAASRDVYLVAWADRRNGEANGWDIYATRVTFGGRVLDPGGIPVCTLPQEQTSPRVASDGRDFLVVWEDARGMNSGGTDFDIYGARITLEGRVLQTNGFPICRASRAQNNPSIAWNGQLYLVGWCDQRASTPSLSEFDIWAARVSQAGAVLDSAGIPLCTAAGLQNAPAVSARAGEFFVCWNDLRTAGSAIRGTTVTTDGTVEIPDGGWFSSSSAAFGPAVDALSSGSLIVWVHNPPVAGGGSEVWATITGHPGGGPRDQWLLSQTFEYQGACDAATRSNRFLAVWMQERFDGEPTRIWATRGGPSSLTPSNRFEITAQADPLAWNGPQLGASTAGYAVAWVTKQPEPSAASDIMLSRISPNGVVLDREGILVSRASRLTPVITWAAPAPIVYGVPLGASQLNASANVPGRFVYSPAAGTFLGAGLQQTLTTVFIPDDPQTYATIAAQATIDVSPAPLLIAADNQEKRQGAPNPPLTAAYKGLVAGDTPASLDYPASLATTATTDSPPGEYPIIVSGAVDPNYSITFSNGVLVVRVAGTGPGSLDVAINANLAEGANVRDVTRQPDGKIIAAGWFRTLGEVTRSNLVRFNADASVDPSFRALGFCGQEFYSAALQPDGNILVGMPEPICLSSQVLGLLRLKPDGSLDTTFRAGSGVDRCRGGVRSVAIQPDGRIIIGGGFFVGSRETVARLLANGSIDPSFDAGPIQISDEDGDAVYALILQPDGKILVHSDISEVQGRAVDGLFRLLPDGKLDPEFSPPNGWVASVVLQPDGKLVVGANFDGQSTARLFRLNSNGTLDPSFEQAAARQIFPTALALQPDGRIIGAGYNSTFEDILVVRYETTGALDTGFDCGRGADASVTRLLVTPEHIVVAGWFSEFDGIPRQGLAWLRRGAPTPDSFVCRNISGLAVQLTAGPPENTLAWAVEETPPFNWGVTNISHRGTWDRATGKVKFGPFFDDNSRTLSYRVLPPLGFVGVGLFSGQASADGKSTPVIGDDRIVIPTQHPADRSPADWKLTMDEATGYAAAWRSGADWPVPPNPILVDYVTRASALWRGGEAYRLDPSVEGPPLWWVNTEVPPVRQDGEPQPLEAFRRVPPLYVPGQPLEAAIHVTTSPVFRAYAVEEQIPEGWSARAISDGGQVDSVNRLIKWGPFHDATPRTLRYTLVPPTTALGRIALAGSASYDGTLVRIAGCNMLYCSSRLTWNRRQTQPGWGLQLTGEIGERYVVERSTDLTTWTGVTTVTNETGTVEVPNVGEPAARKCYYRARLVAGQN